MVSKEKLTSLLKYQAQLRERLTNDVPEKHEDHPETFKQYLERELGTVTTTINDAKLELGVK